MFVNEGDDVFIINGCVEFIVFGFIFVGFGGEVNFDVVMFNSLNLVMISEVGDMVIKGDNKVGSFVLVMINGGDIIDFGGMMVEVDMDVMLMIDNGVGIKGEIVLVDGVVDVFMVGGNVFFEVVEGI